MTINIQSVPRSRKRIDRCPWSRSSKQRLAHRRFWFPKPRSLATCKTGAAGTAGPRPGSCCPLSRRRVPPPRGPPAGCGVGWWKKGEIPACLAARCHGRTVRRRCSSTWRACVPCAPSTRPTIRWWWKPAACWRRCSRRPANDGGCTRSVWGPRGLARSAAISPPTPGAPGCCATAIPARTSWGWRGWCLKYLLIGAEGTLGVITAACLKLHPLPTGRAVAWMAVPNPAAALDMLALFQRRCGASLSAFEMMNGPQLDYVLEHVPGRRAPLPASYAWHVLVELADSGAEPALTGALQETLQQGLAQGRVLDASLAASGPQRAALWALRHSVSQANKQAGIGLSTDCALPVSAVPEFIERATLAVHRIMPGLPIIIVAHLGDGNVHFIPLIPFAGFGPWSAVADRQATASAASAVRQAVHAVAHALGGSFSAEHGIGQLLTQEMARFKPAVELAMMRGIKGLLDPQQLFNPGRLFPAVATIRTSAGTDVEGTSDECPGPQHPFPPARAQGRGNRRWHARRCGMAAIRARPVQAHRHTRRWRCLQQGVHRCVL